MSNLIDDPKFRADVVFGYTALNKLLDQIDRGVKLYEWQADAQQMAEVDEEITSPILSDLEKLRATLQSLMVGVRIEEVRR